jgi:hypothetical protein
MGRYVHCSVETGWSAINHGGWAVRGLTVAQEPGFAYNTGILSLRDTVIFDGDTDVITYATAESTHHVIDLHITLLGT